MAGNHPDRNKVLLSRAVSWVIGGSIVILIAVGLVWPWLETSEPQPVPRADPDDPEQVALGKQIYEQYCAVCHGDQLQGQPDWRRRLPSGKLPAPPHDETGHTWHHADEVLFRITKYGMVPPYAPEDYESDMPAFQHVLSDDEIRAVLAYIKSTWPPEIREWQEKIDRQARQQR